MLKLDDVCVVKIAMERGWPTWSLAYIVDFDKRDETMFRVKVIGEDFTRDDWVYCYTIEDATQQAKAFKLAKSQWGKFVKYASENAIRAAILAA